MNRLALAAVTVLALVACGSDPAPPPAQPPPLVAPPPPEPPASPPPAPAPPPEVEWKTIFDFASLPPARVAKPDDKKIVALATDIKKAHKECGAAGAAISSEAPRQGAFT